MKLITPIVGQRQGLLEDPGHASCFPYPAMFTHYPQAHECSEAYPATTLGPNRGACHDLTPSLVFNASLNLLTSSAAAAFGTHSEPWPFSPTAYTQSPSEVQAPLPFDALPHRSVFGARNTLDITAGNPADQQELPPSWCDLPTSPYLVGRLSYEDYGTFGDPTFMDIEPPDHPLYASQAPNIDVCSSPYMGEMSTINLGLQQTLVSSKP